MKTSYSYQGTVEGRKRNGHSTQGSKIIAIGTKKVIITFTFVLYEIRYVCVCTMCERLCV